MKSIYVRFNLKYVCGNANRVNNLFLFNYLYCLFMSDNLCINIVGGFYNFYTLFNLFSLFIAVLCL